MNYLLIYSVVGISIVICIIYVFNFRILASIKKFGVFILKKFAGHSAKKTLEKIKLNKVENKKKGLLIKYQYLVENLIFDYNVPITIEGFNSFLIIFLGLVILSVYSVFHNFILSILIAFSVVIALFTYAVIRARKLEASKIEAIMDAEDIICPLARDGVLVAIKKVLESKDYIHSNIRSYFVEFVDNCENHGYSFKEAMFILNRQLGSKFDNFAERAIIFEYNERKGMADIFLDIVDENAALREINARKERSFRKINKEFFIKNVLILLFVLYALTGDGFRNFIFHTNLGLFINGVAIIVVCLSFTRSQILQRDIGANKRVGGKF